MSGASNFLITSDYPTDKIVWMYEGTATTDVDGVFDIVIPHGLNAIPFCTGIWTIDDWATTYNTSTAVHGGGQYYQRYSMLTSNSTEVVLHGYCTYTDGNPIVSATVKYRIWGFFNEGTTLNIFADTTAGLSENKFVKDSRLGYPKLFMEGFADATHQTQTVYHNLGFIPFVEIWYELGGTWYQLDYIDFESADTSWTVKNSAQSISFNGESYTNYNYYYRIYADE